MAQKALAVFLMLGLSTPSFAECVFSKDIKENADGSYTYSKECHIQVGKKMKELDNLNISMGEMKKAIDLRDLALKKESERADMWMDTAFKVKDRFDSYDSLQNKNNILYFVAGVGLTALSVWAAGQLR